MDAVNMIMQINDEIHADRGLSCRPDDDTWKEVVEEIAAAISDRPELAGAITPEVLDSLTDHNYHTARKAAEMAIREPWKVFFDADTGEEYVSYTMRGTFAGEEDATKELIAGERGINADQIAVRIEYR